MTPAPQTVGGAPTALPPLRGDIALELAPERSGGFPRLVVTDPVRGSYFRLAWPESGILLHWQEASDVEDLSERLRRSYGLEVSREQITAVAEFAATNQLTRTDAAGGWQRYATVRAAGKHGLVMTVIHGYLFFRIPLVHPEQALRRLLPRLSFVYSRFFWLLLSAVALVAGYLATRQWSALVAAAHEAMRFEAMLLHAVAILGLKGVHELGHALTTLRHGCRVPSMGVAVMLGAPVLYTDTSDSWRLPQRAQRLAIVFAGVAAELIVATLALLLWVFLPDGMARQTCFSLATASIVLSLLVNLNPFMRFDGYFALSDYLEVPNLQARAFALATWRLREVLFNLGHPPPETLPRAMTRTLIVYALITWVYRLVLYLGIAAVVYAMAGKAIGIILGLFEVVIFIARPIWKELTMWWTLRAQILRPARAPWTAAAVAGCLALLVAPWMATIEAPSVMVAGSEESVHMPFSGRLRSMAVSEGQQVEAGQVLFIADSTDLDRQYAKATIERRSLELQTNRLHAHDKELSARLVIESKLAQVRERLAALDRQRRQLEIRAPFAGTVVDLDVDISRGVWLNPKLPMARIVAEQAPKVRGLVAETDIARLRDGATAVFVGDDPTSKRRSLRLASIAPASDGRLVEAVLADKHGGNVAASDEKGEMRTRHGWFEVTFETDGERPSQLVRGSTRIDAAGISPLVLVWQQVSRVLVREQGF